MKLCLAIATHNFKWVKITRICLIWDQAFANYGAYTLVSLPISVILSIIKTDF